MLNTRATRVICLILALAMAPIALTGCIGSFAAWHKVHEFNKNSSDNEWIQELLFIVLNIIPVYGIAYLIDVVIINSIEFWTGENPMNTARTIVGEDGAVTTITPLDDNTLEVSVVTPDGRENTFQLERGTETVTARDADGNVVARAAMAEDGAQLVPVGN